MPRGRDRLGPAPQASRLKDYLVIKPPPISLSVVIAPLRLGLAFMGS